MRDTRIRRALLFMPGDSRSKIEKGISLGVDSIIMDLEDGVALNQKPAARATIATALRELNFGRTEKLVRLNPVNSTLFEDDFAATISAHPEGYVIPKVESGAMISTVSDMLRDAEAAHGWDLHSTALIAIIETARGIVHLTEIAESNRRLVALAFGAEDLAGDIGAIRTLEGSEVFYARSAVVLHAKAYGLQAIDTPFIRLDDEDGLINETGTAVQMGYTGKLAIHPKQIAPIHQIFTPSEEEIRAAQRLIHAYDEQQAAGTGAFQLDGKMVDMPMIRAAHIVLDRARAAGIEVEP
jgi:citrate lyase beta subunit